MNEILIVSNYFPPERGAAANRIGRLAFGLADRGFNVTVVCPLPNYPEGKVFPGYEGKFTRREIVGKVAVTRLWIYPSKSANPFARMLSIASFSSILFVHLLFGKLPKSVVVQSPPLLLSFLSVLVLKIRGRKIILNISDLWPLAAVELGAVRENSISHKIALFFERYIYKNADTIIGQSREILDHVRRSPPGKPAFLYRNFPDEPALQVASAQGKIKIFYAGLLGVAQGVLEACAHLKPDPRYEFHIFGDGAQKEEIVNFISDNKIPHIFYHGMVPQNQLAQRICSFDIAFVPLKTRIFGSVPSKIFEYSAQGFPILYCGGGEGGDIVHENKIGWVCEPGDYDALNSIIGTILQMPREAIENMKKEVLAVAAREFNIQSQLDSLAAQGIFQ